MLRNLPHAAKGPQQSDGEASGEARGATASDGEPGVPKACDPTAVVAAEAGVEGGQEEEPAGDFGSAMQTAAKQMAEQTPAPGIPPSCLDSQPPSASPAPQSALSSAGDAADGSRDVSRGQEVDSGSDAHGAGGQGGAVLR